MERVFQSPWLRIAGLAGVGLVLGVLALAVGERLLWRGKVLPGVEIAGIDVGGRSERATYAAVRPVARRLEAAPIRARAGRVDLTLDPSALGLRVEAAATVRAARRDGRRANPVGPMVGVVGRRIRPDRVPLVVHLDVDRLEGVLDGWAALTTKGLQDGALRFDGATVVAISPRSGTGLRRDEARRRLESAITSGRPGVIELPVGQVRPTVGAAAVRRAAREARRLLAAPVTVAAGFTPITLAPEQLATALTATPVRSRLVLGIDLAKLHAALGTPLARLELPPVNASFAVNGNAVGVVPSQMGRAVDLASVATGILRGERVIIASVREIPPVHDTAWAQQLNITELVSTFTTNHACCAPRVTNIHVAADAINNTVVEPDQTFSLNDALGSRTPDKGYVQAPSIGADLGLVEAYGGGVSQLSTTLFNATYFGGYNDVTHEVHAIYISRYPMGREATLNYPSIDNKFQNDSHSGVLIRTSYSSTSITVSFYGNKEGRTVKTEGPNILETVAPEVQFADTPLLAQGTQQEIQSGEPGYTVENFRIISRPGQPDERQRFVAKYSMVPQQIARGTGPPPATPPAPPAAAPPPTPTPPPTAPPTPPPT
jgi:vancomycin resistance protein YoaR